MKMAPRKGAGQWELELNQHCGARVQSMMVATKVRLVTAVIDGSPMQLRVGNLPSYTREVQSVAEQIALDYLVVDKGLNP